MAPSDRDAPVPARRTQRRRVTPLLLALTLLLSTLLLTLAVPAEAHNQLQGTAPADTSTVAAVPAEIVLTFDEPAVALGTQVVVSGPDGPVQVGEPTLVDATVAQAIQAGAPAGAYTVNWRVTSADGHPISGTFTFTAEAAGGGSQSASAAPSAEAAPVAAGSSTAGTVVLVALLVLLVVGVAAVVRTRVRRSRRSRV